MTCPNNNPTRFYCKEQTKQAYNKKAYPKIDVEQTKGNGELPLFIPIRHLAQKNKINKLPTHMSPSFILEPTIEEKNKSRKKVFRKNL
jgi:hypothetical protein